MPNKYCIVCGEGPSPNIRLHHFPRNKERRVAWLEAMNMNNRMKDVHRFTRICGHHFPTSAFYCDTREKLIRNAVPSLFPSSVPNEAPPLIITETPVVAQSDQREIHVPENTRNTEITSEFTTIDMPEDDSDLQLVENCDLLQNLSLFDAKIFSINDFKLALSHPLGLTYSCKENDNLHQTTSENEDQTELTSTPVEDQTERMSTPIELEEIVEDQNSNEIEVEPSPDLTEVNPDKTTAFSKKPWFKSIKCYLPDSNKFAEVCRICFCPLIAEDVIKLCGEEISIEEETRLKNMLMLVLPEMDLEMYSNTVICKKCVQLLESSCQLKGLWLCTESRLREILEKKKAAINQNADLIILTEEGENETSAGTDHSHTKTSTNLKQQSTDSGLGQFSSGSGNSFPKKQTKQVSSRKKIRKTKKIWGMGPFMCEQCGCIFTDLKKLRRHLAHHKRETKERKVMCELCGALFLTCRSLKTHSLMHAQPKCSFCGKQFEHIKILKRHIHYVHTRTSFQCHLCGKLYPYARSLQFHLMLHDPSKKLYACNMCGKRYVAPSFLRRHQLVHATEHKWTCDYCGKSMKYEKSLTNHVKNFHVNEGEFVCEFCSKPFLTKNDLQRHRIRVHGCISENQEKVVWANETNDCTNVPDYEIEHEL